MPGEFQVGWFRIGEIFDSASNVNRLNLVGIPNQDLIVVTSGGYKLTVVRKISCVDRAIMTREFGDFVETTASLRQ